MLRDMKTKKLKTKKRRVVITAAIMPIAIVIVMPIGISKDLK